MAPDSSVFPGRGRPTGRRATARAADFTAFGPSGDAWSRSGEAKGVLLPSGVRVIDMQVGEGPLPAKGERVWCHFKAWPRGFRSGPPADSSFLNTRPYDWALGNGGDGRLPAGADEGAVGMREGGWRRLVIPAKLAYGEAGLPTGRGAYLINPNEDVYFELNMVDGGSGKCVRTLATEGYLRPFGLGLGAVRVRVRVRAHPKLTLNLTICLRTLAPEGKLP